MDNKVTNVLKNEDVSAESSLNNNNSSTNVGQESSVGLDVSRTLTLGSTQQQNEAASSFKSNVGEGESGVGVPFGGCGNNNNCVDYMQQQNHIFVFSTQLANKGAEAVLSGQFPTIISYHCSQPETKSFLEDFFVKNPMKITKLQRQNTLNLCNLSMVEPGGTIGGPSAQWFADCNNSMHKISAKTNSGIGMGVADGSRGNSKICYVRGSVSSLGGNLENSGSRSQTPVGLRAAVNMTGIDGFIGSPVDTPTLENDLMCWGQSARSGLDGSTLNDVLVHGLKILDDPSVTPLNSNKLLVSGCTSAVCIDVGGTSVDSGIPSLQGVKVPDENLTPQQRQHREEQLAKLKKMNQFLFPENGGAVFRPDSSASVSNKIGSVVSSDADGLPGQLGLLHNLPGVSAVAAASVKNTLKNSVLRSVPGNLFNASKSAETQEHITLGRSADNTAAISMVTSERLDSRRDLSGSGVCVPCNGVAALNKSGGPGICQQTNITCGVPSVSGGVMTMCGVPGIGDMNCAGGGGTVGISAANNLMPNSPEVPGGIPSSFGQNCGGSGSVVGVLGDNMSGKMLGSSGTASLHQGSNLNVTIGGAMAITEWSKLQQIAVEERLNCINEFTESYARPIPHGGGSVRPGQGPPPPYHQHQQNQPISNNGNSTQRSASVPINIQSPNPASPNNPTSNLSLPSPRTTYSGALGMPVNSPIMDLHSIDVRGTVTTISTTTAASNMSGKINFIQCQQQEGSPNSMGGANSGNANNRNRSSLNQFNSNPSTPLSHMSPKDFESFNGANTGDLKNSRQNLQRPKTPLIAGNAGEQCTVSNMDSNGPISGLAGSRFTNRQSSTPVLPMQFCRRTDNVPLNPNSGRSGQNKINHNAFDPISSLAQMSQQLTSCVSLNSSVAISNSPGGGSSTGGPGSGPVTGIIGMLASTNDLNTGGNLNPNGIEGMLASIDNSMDICNPGGPPNSINMPHLNSGGNGLNSILPNNSHLQSMFGPGMGQRLVNHKIYGAPSGGCLAGGGFNPGGGSLNGPMGINIRDLGCDGGPVPLHGVMPPGNHRLMTTGRMAVNLNNFNISPNIQVKASTPNTIQYMPLRPQNQNVNNVRVPPSLEFLHRYTNPQISGVGTVPGSCGPGPSNIIDNTHMSQLGANSANDPTKLSATGVNQLSGTRVGNAIHFFQQQQCNTIDSMLCLEQEHNILRNGTVGDSGVANAANSILSGLNLTNAPMMRTGTRAMRQLGCNTSPNANACNSLLVNGGPRIQASLNAGSNIIDSMECVDAIGESSLFSSTGAGSAQMYIQQQQEQQKVLKAMPDPPIIPSNMNQCSQTTVTFVNANNGHMPISSIILSNKLQGGSEGGSGAGTTNVILGVSNSCNMISGGTSIGGSLPGDNGASDPGPSGSASGGVTSYKSFASPNYNDLKYAQQYHSFQQQLYATSTRGQGGGGAGSAGMAGTNSVGTVASSNNTIAAFFVNK